MKTNKHFILGIYDDEDILVQAVKNIRKASVKIHEVYSPFPVHGLDEALGYTKTRLPIAAFIFGVLGTSLALLMQIWMMGYDWPMIIGGKNAASLSPFIPVAFELTVLISALGMVATFFIISDLKPYKWPLQFDTRSTDDKHVVAIDLDLNDQKKNDIALLLEKNGAQEVNYKKLS